MIILVVGMSTTQLTSMVTLNGNTFTSNDVYARYSTNSQTQSFANECDTSNCANSGPQTQADGTAIAPVISLFGGGQGEQGLPGPPGPKGEPGPAGPAGPQGPDKELQARVVSGDVVEVSSNELELAVAECDPDEVATGGGIANTGGGNVINPFTADSQQEDPPRWEMNVINPDPNPIGIEAFAVCAKLVDAP